MADASAQAIAALMSGQSMDGISTEGGDTAPEATSPEPALAGTEDQTKPDPSTDVERMIKGEDDEGKAKPDSDSDRYEVVEINGKNYRVDTTDREQVRKAVRMAARGRKFQSERDTLQAKLATRDKEFTEIKSVLDKLEQYKDDPKAMVKIFSGGKVDFDTLLKQESEKARLREEATPDERAQMDSHEELTRTKRENAELRKQMQDHLKEVTTAKEEAQFKSIQSKLEPTFEKVRYAGKLGDSVAEESIDRTLWREAISRLEEYPDDVELTPELVNKEFKAVKAALDKVVKLQADQRVKTVTTERKRQAKETAQVQASRGTENTTVEKDFAQKVRSGDLRSILANPAKYFSILGK